MPRSPNDLGAVVITLSYAALTLEGAESRWTLVWVMREDCRDDPRIRRFVTLYRSPGIKSFILTRFDGTILPTW